MVQKNLFPAIVKGLLRVFVLAALENGRKRGDVLNRSPKPVRQKKKKIGESPASASRKRISDLRLPFLIEPGRELSIDLTSKTKRRRIISLTVRGIGPAVELTRFMFISITHRRHGCLINLPPDTTRRALSNSEISPQCSRSKHKSHHAPIWQLAPRIRGRLEMIVKFVDRATQVYDWELSRRVSSTTKAAELFVPTSSVIVD